MQQPESTLIIILAAIMSTGKEVPPKAKAIGKTRQHLHTQLPGAMLEIEHNSVKLRDHRLVGPKTIHMWQGNLEGLLIIRRSSGRPYL